jgi:SAM-dependent methyltransferase
MIAQGRITIAIPASVGLVLPIIRLCTGWCRVKLRSDPRAMIRDVPSPIDLRRMVDARAWEATAMAKRPWRPEFFAQFASAMAASAIPVRRVLELGSGPGFLAEHLLRALPSISYVALDNSAAMHQLAAQRLGALAVRVQFVERSFRQSEWPQDLGRFDCVVTNQAVHEMRHKHHAGALHSQVHRLLARGGAYLVCDHFVGDGGMQDTELYMTVQEQRAALLAAGFDKVKPLLVKGGMVLHHAV